MKKLCLSTGHWSLKTPKVSENTDLSVHLLLNKAKSGHRGVK